ncbi:MAG TPA: DNA alkylation repair protein [bacterium]|nr:DNA alkylation repair protein [bacterium]HPN45878.1 DNA alkylation repair protein [bacterium]
MSEIIAQVIEELKRNVDEKTLATGQNFFKEKIQLYGVKTALVTKISKDYFKQIANRSKEEIFGFCEELWKSGYMENTFIACNWSYYIHERYERLDFAVFENWVNEFVNNWAACDTLCNHTVGTFVEMYPEYVANLKEWAKSANRWMRRAAAVTLIIPARHGLFLLDVFEIANILLLDTDDLVQKGYGWMLKAASEAHQQEVFEYVLAIKAVMPRTALRYAIEKMPAEMKKRAMEK